MIAPGLSRRGCPVAPAHQHVAVEAKDSARWQLSEAVANIGFSPIGGFGIDRW